MKLKVNETDVLLNRNLVVLDNFVLTFYFYVGLQ